MNNLNEYKITNILGDWESSIIYTAESKENEVVFIATAKNGIDAEQFYKNAIFLRQFKIKSFLQVIDIFEENNNLYFVFKSFKGYKLLDYIENNKDINYRSAFEFLKPLFLGLDIAERNNVYFDIKTEDLLIDKDLNIYLYKPFLLDISTEDQIWNMANIYYRVLTGNDYQEGNLIIEKKITIELEQMLYKVLNNEISFSCIKNFVNTVDDAIRFGTLKEADDSASKNDKKNKSTFFPSFMFITSIILIFIITISSVATPLINTISSFEKRLYALNELKDSESDIKTNIKDELEYQEVIVNYFNLDNSNYYNIKGIVIEADGYVYSNLFDAETDVYKLYKENIETGKQEVISEDIGMEYMTVYNDNIYFSNTHDNHVLYGMKTDGSNIRKITDYDSKYIQIDSKGKNLYYVANKNDNYTINKIGIDGNNEEIYINSISDIEFFIYINMYDAFKKSFVDESSGFSNIVSDKFYDYRIYNDILFFIDDTSSEIGSMDKNGNKVAFPYIVKAVDYRIYDNIMYYVSKEGIFESLNLKTAERTEICDDIDNIIEITKNVAYLINYEDSILLKITKQDGKFNKKNIERFDL